MTAPTQTPRRSLRLAAAVAVVVTIISFALERAPSPVQPRVIILSVTAATNGHQVVHYRLDPPAHIFDSQTEVVFAADDLARLRTDQQGPPHPLSTLLSPAMTSRGTAFSTEPSAAASHTVSYAPIAPVCRLRVRPLAIAESLPRRIRTSLIRFSIQPFSHPYWAEGHPILSRPITNTLYHLRGIPETQPSPTAAQ